MAKNKPALFSLKRRKYQENSLEGLFSCVCVTERVTPLELPWCTALFPLLCTAATQTQADTAGKDVWNKNKIKRSVLHNSSSSQKSWCECKNVDFCDGFWPPVSGCLLGLWPLLNPDYSGSGKPENPDIAPAGCTYLPCEKECFLVAWRTLKRTVFKVWFLQWLWRPNWPPIEEGLFITMVSVEVSPGYY